MSNHTIVSKDCKLKVQYSEVTHVCICMSVHALLQYFLLHDEDVIQNHTCYFLSEHISDSISDKLPAIKMFVGDGFRKRITKIHTHLFSRVKYPFLKKSMIFAQDHGFPISIIGNLHYNLLSDGPRFLTTSLTIDTYMQKSAIRHSMRGLVERLLYGNITLYPMASGNQCDKIFLTEIENVQVCQTKPIEVNSLLELWTKSTFSKKQFISSVFAITDADVELLKSKPLMFFSQPITADFGLSDEEYVSLLSAILKRYDVHKIILKTHPRDKFNYHKYFPNITIFEKPINMQLLVLYDVCPQKAITLFSSSVDALPESVEVDWYGVECHHKIQSHYAKPIIPNRSCNRIVMS